MFKRRVSEFLISKAGYSVNLNQKKCPVKNLTGQFWIFAVEKK
jgi:hypothetical protein